MVGLSPREAERIGANHTYGDWLTARLADLESHCRTEPPVRTDEGKTIPLPAPVRTAARRKSALTRRQTEDFLI